MDRGRAACPVGNKLCAARVHKRYEDMRAQRLREMKPQIDARPPKVCGMKHLQTNWKRDEMLGVRYDEIERDNRHLLHKMSKVVEEPGSLPKSRSEPNLSKANSGAAFPGGPARRNEIARIEFENQRMLKRLQNAHAEYRTKDWEAAHDRSRAYLRRICDYPIPDILKPKRRGQPSASMVPLLSEEPETFQAGMDPSAVAPEFASPMGQGLRYVVKEHLLIAGTTFFVEMATDGRTLAVSAYDREIQDTLELLVNEEHHRQLLLESGGDYGEIAGRLRIKDDRLIIIPLDAASGGYE